MCQECGFAHAAKMNEVIMYLCQECGFAHAAKMNEGRWLYICVRSGVVHMLPGYVQKKWRE